MSPDIVQNRIRPRGGCDNLVADGPRTDGTWPPSRNASTATALSARQPSVSRRTPSEFIVYSAILLDASNVRTARQPPTGRVERTTRSGTATER